MVYDVEVFQRDGPLGSIPAPEVTIYERPDDYPLPQSRGFSTSNGGYHQTNTYRFYSRFDAENFVRTHC